MTDQPYTPTETTVRYWYIYARRASAEFNLEQVPDTSEAWAEFDRWLAERDARIEAAAEQRGAIKELREAATDIEKNNIVFDGDHYQPCNSCMSIHMNWLDYRADRIANKENE